MDLVTSGGPLRLQRGHWELNPGPIGLQPIALPLSYTPFPTPVIFHEKRFRELTTLEAIWAQVQTCN